MIAAAETDINQASQNVITPSPSISSTNGTTVTTTSPTPTSTTSEQFSDQFSYPTISAATATLTSAVLGGAAPTGPYLLPGDEYFLHQVYPTDAYPQSIASQLPFERTQANLPTEEFRQKKQHRRSKRRHHRKGHISLFENHSDQVSDIAPLDLSPDGGSDDLSRTPSTGSALSSDSEISRSDLSDTDEEDRSTIRRRLIVDKNNNEKNIVAQIPQLDRNQIGACHDPNFKEKTPKNSELFFKYLFRISAL